MSFSGPEGDLPTCMYFLPRISSFLNKTFQFLIAQFTLLIMLPLKHSHPPSPVYFRSTFILPSPTRSPYQRQRNAAIGSLKVASLRFDCGKFRGLRNDIRNGLV